MIARRSLPALGALALAAATAAAIWLYRDYVNFLETPLHGEPGPRLIQLEAGTSYQAMIRRLEDKGLVESPFHWRILGWRLDAGRRIRAGEYAVEPGATPPELLDDVINGRVVQYAFTIVEGWTFRDLMRGLGGHEVLVHTLEGLPGNAVMERLGYPQQHPEGRFLPETYHFPRGTADEALLRRAHRAMAAELDSAWAERDSGLPYETPGEVLTMASIIEKETAVPEERRRIAGVFVRRMERGMRLQTDPTVIYGMGDSYAGNIRRDDLQADSPYNTYTRAGLPPTPIAMPGRDSIKAAVHPADGTELYFVARGDGTHVFSDTLEEHNRAVARYQLSGKGDSE